MPREIASYLKLHDDDSSRIGRPAPRPLPTLGELCQAFAAATGWPLSYETGEVPRDNSLWSARCRPKTAPPPAAWRSTDPRPAKTARRPTPR